VQKKRDTHISTLAFIDVMACGLGAVILLFFILDFEEGAAEIQNSPAEQVEEPENLERAREYEHLIEERKIRLSRIENLTKEVSEYLVKIVEKDLSAKNTLEKKMLPLLPKESNNSNPLIGLSVSGPKILIVLDTSASMAHSTLIEIISGLDDPSGKFLKAGTKWRQAKNITQWLIEQAPNSSLVSVFGYANNITFSNSSWSNKASALAYYTAKISSVSPRNGTNLDTALKHIRTESSEVSDIYIITDGLPTLSGKRNARNSINQFFSGCLKSNNKYVSGECREIFFLSAVKAFSEKSSARINIVLLELEGDPKAAHLYQHWANSTGGTLLSPSSRWLK